MFAWFYGGLIFIGGDFGFVWLFIVCWLVFWVCSGVWFVVMLFISFLFVCALLQGWVVVWVVCF